MALFAVNNTMGGSEQNLTSSYKTIVGITAATGAATLKRGWIYEIEVGADGQPNSTDCAIVYDWSRQTTVGTATAVVPAPLDSADTAAGLVCNVNHTVEPTITAVTNLLTISLNQRNSQRWVARDDRSALVIPATNLAGVAARAKSGTYTSTVIVHEHFEE
jgi:hypothetical protein